MGKENAYICKVFIIHRDAMKHFTKLQAVLFLFVVALFSNGNSCNGPKDTTPGNCDNRKGILSQSVIHVGTTREFFSMSTPIAKNDCEAHYSFTFFWANPRRVKTDTIMPPLHNLDQAFRPEDEFAYFGHPLPVRTKDFIGDRWRWDIVFDVGNKNSGFSNTRYGVNTFVESINPADSVLVNCDITYTPFQ